MPVTPMGVQDKCAGFPNELRYADVVEVYTYRFSSSASFLRITDFCLLAAGEVGNDDASLQISESGSCV